MAIFLTLYPQLALPLPLETLLSLEICVCIFQPGWDLGQGDSWFNGFFFFPTVPELVQGCGRSSNEQKVNCHPLPFWQVCVLLIQHELRKNKRAETPFEVLAYPLEKFKAVVHCLNFPLVNYLYSLNHLHTPDQGRDTAKYKVEYLH